MMKRFIIASLAIISTLFLSACLTEPTPTINDNTAVESDVPLLTATADADPLSADTADSQSNAESAPPYPDIVDLRGKRLSLDEMNELCDAHPDNTHLFTLRFADIETDSTVTQLDISGHTLNSVDDILPYLRFMPQLTYLDMCNCGLSNDQMEELTDAYPDIKFVWVLQLGGWHLRTDTVAFSTLSNEENPHKLTSEDLDVLKYCTELKALDLGHHAIDDLSWVAPLTELRILILACNQITDITPLAQLKELRYLELFENRQITDITPLTQLNKLQDLNIGSCFNITDYSPLAEIQSLERLWANFTVISGDELSLITQQLTNCRICCLENGGATEGGWRSHPRYDAMRDMFMNDYLHDLFV